MGFSCGINRFMWAVAYFRRVVEAQTELDGLVRTYLPRGTRITKPRYKHSPVESHYPLFGNMLFIEYRKEIVREVKLIKGFRQFIRVDKKIALCPPEQVEALMQAEARGEFRYDYNKPEGYFDEVPLKIGDTVKVRTKLVGGEGTITKVDKDQVTIELPGWLHDLTLSSERVERIDD